VSAGGRRRRDHGTASAELAGLLLALREVADVDARVQRLVDRGARVPGFGSHEHKGSHVDPRVLIYQRVTETLRQRDPAAWYWEMGERLAEAMRTVQEKRGRPPLPLNPDYYMTLLHLCLDISPERMPMSFLAARLMGWCATFVESRTGQLA
jgi:citrate synthase